MKKYNDKELNRLLSESDELLSDLNLNLYETPEEEELRIKQQQQKEEEAARQERQKEREAEQAFVETAVTVEPSRGEDWQGSPLAGILFIMLSFMFMEAVTHLGTYGTLGTNFIYPLFFAAALGCIVCLLAGFLHNRGNTRIALILQILFAAYCDLQLIYHAAIGSFLRLSQPREDMWLLLHSGQIKEAVMAVMPWLVLMLFPVIFWAVLGRRFFSFQQSSWLTRLVFMIGAVLFVVIGILMLDLKGHEDYTPYAAFYSYESGVTTEQAGNQLGMTAIAFLELLQML